MEPCVARMSTKPAGIPPVKTCTVKARCYWRSATQLGFEIAPKDHPYWRAVYKDVTAKDPLNKVRVGTKVTLSLSKKGIWSVKL